MWKVREIYWRILWMWKRREYSLVQYHLSRRLVGTQKGYLCRCSVHVGVKSNPQLLQRLQKCDNKIRFQAVVNVFKFDKFKSTLRRSSREVFLTSVVKNSFLKSLWNPFVGLCFEGRATAWFDFFIKRKWSRRFLSNLVPRVLSYPPYGARERERPWKTLVTCLPESGRLQTNDLGERQVSVRFVSTERTWPDLERRK